MLEFKVGAVGGERREQARCGSDMAAEAPEAQSDDPEDDELTEAFIPVAGLVGLLLVIIVGAVVVFALAALQNL